MEWYKKSKEEVVSQLSTSTDKGLSNEEAQKRLEKYGPNALKEEGKQSMLSKIIAQFNDFLILILIVAAVISYFVGEKVDAVVIIAIVIVNAALGIYQEGKAEKSLEALKKMAAPSAKVLRNGNVEVIPSIMLFQGILLF